MFIGRQRSISFGSSEQAKLVKTSALISDGELRLVKYIIELKILGFGVSATKNKSKYTFDLRSERFGIVTYESLARIEVVVSKNVFVFVFQCVYLKIFL